MFFNVAKIASARASSMISLTKSLRVAGPLRWTASSELRSLIKWGSHTDAAYSRVGLVIGKLFPLVFGDSDLGYGVGIPA